MDICRATGLEVFPSRMTQSEAYVLATHRLKMAGVKIIIIDELHNLLGSKKEAANLFLKGFFHDADGLCLIAIGTERLRQFIYDDQGFTCVVRLMPRPRTCLRFSLRQFRQNRTW